MLQMQSDRGWWRVQDVARLASEYCAAYLIEFILSKSFLGRIDRSLGRFSRNDEEIVYTAMQAFESIQPLDEEFSILQFNFAVRRVLDKLIGLGRYKTHDKLVSALREAGYMKPTPVAPASAAEETEP